MASGRLRVPKIRRKKKEQEEERKKFAFATGKSDLAAGTHYFGYAMGGAPFSAYSFRLI